MVVEPEEPQREAPLRLHAAIGLGAADPMAVRLLPRDQPVDRGLRAAAQRRAEIVRAFRTGRLFEFRCRHKNCPGLNDASGVGALGAAIRSPRFFL